MAAKYDGEEWQPYWMEKAYDSKTDYGRDVVAFHSRVLDWFSNQMELSSFGHLTVI